MFIIGPGHSFELFAEAIDAAFARWDLGHLHEFELGDGRLSGYPDVSYALEVVWLDHARLKVTREVKPGDEFVYTLDLGYNWQHRYVVERSPDGRAAIRGQARPRKDPSFIMQNVTEKPSSKRGGRRQPAVAPDELPEEEQDRLAGLLPEEALQDAEGP